MIWASEDWATCDDDQERALAENKENPQAEALEGSQSLYNLTKVSNFADHVLSINTFPIAFTVLPLGDFVRACSWKSRIDNLIGYQNCG